jgi:hypothetical protein
MKVEIAQLIEEIWQRAPPGREAAERNEVMRLLQQFADQPMPSGKRYFRMRLSGCTLMP